MSLPQTITLRDVQGFVSADNSSAISTSLRHPEDIVYILPPDGKSFRLPIVRWSEVGFPPTFIRAYQKGRVLITMESWPPSRLLFVYREVFKRCYKEARP